MCGVNDSVNGEAKKDWVCCTITTLKDEEKTPYTSNNTHQRKTAKKHSTILKTDNTHHKQTTQFPSFSQIYT